MRGSVRILIYITAVLLLAAGCGGGGTSLNPQGSELNGNQSVQLIPPYQAVAVPESLPPLFTDPTPDDGITLDIIGGQQYLGGHINIWTDDEYFYMKAWTVGDWTMSAIDLYVGSTPPDSSGSPGQFPYHYGAWDPYITTYEIDPIPLSELEVGFKSEVYVAIHVNIHGPSDETAWAGDWNDGSPQWDYHWEKKWGGYMGVCLPPVPPLPTDPVAYDGIRFGHYSYWDTRFQDQNLDLPPGEFFIGNDKYYVGWCGDMAKVMYENHIYMAQLYSSYDPDLPVNPLIKITANSNLEFVNFMINQRHHPDPGSPFDGVDWTDSDNYLAFQDAVWYFTNEFIPDPGSLAESLAQYAIDHGDNYIPCEGDWYSLVLYPDTSTDNKNIRAQMVLIEVDP